MKKNRFLCLFLIYSIQLSLVAPFTGAQNSNSVSTKTDQPPVKKGLQFRIREARPEAAEKAASTSVPFVKLNQQESDSILKRLPPLAEPAEKSEFKLRPDTLQPPPTGKIVETKFPAAENQAPPVKTDSRTLDVVRYTPTGNNGLVPELSVTFSQPMTAVTSQTQANENVPVRLSPQVKGKWRWVGTKTLIFDAETRLPMATNFTVTIPAGTKSAVGGTLEKEFSWTFATTPPKVESFPLNNQMTGRDALLLASFDQEINKSDVLAKILAISNGERRALRLATEPELAADEELSKKIKDLPLNRWLAFRTVNPLPPEALVSISFTAGTPSAEGNLITTEAQKFSFKTFGALKFVKAMCGYEEKVKICEPGAGWNLEFNNPLDAKGFDKSQIKIEPKIEDANFYIYGNRIFIRLLNEPQTAYTVTIAKTLKDQFGQTLGEDVSAKFTTGTVRPRVMTPSENFITLDPNAKPEFPVYSINQTKLKVRLYAVKAEDYQDFVTFDSQKSVYPTFGKLVFNQTINVKNIPNKQVETEINIAPALNNGLGHAVLIVEPVTAKGAYNEKIVKWLQATKIGLDTFGDREQLTVYTSNLKDGKPLGNVRVSLSNGPSAVSNENGMADITLIPRKARQMIFLVARQGEDSALLFRDYYSVFYDEDYNDGIYFRNAGWFKIPQKDNLRWFVFDDRKIYRPGETVSVKGYLRKITGGKFSEVSELMNAATGVNYVLKDSRNVQILSGTAKLNAFGAFDLELKLPENVNLGEQHLEFTAASLLGEKEFTHNFQVAEFRRPEFEVETSVESAAPFYLGDAAALVTEAKYYSGGGLANAETEWDISAMPTNYAPPNREDFIFGKFIPWWGSRYENNWSLRTSEEFKGQTDIEGKHHVALDFLKADPARPYTISARADIKDVNRQTFSGSTTLLVHPSKLYVGLRTPKTFVQANETFKIETITTDIDGKTLAGAPVSVKAELKNRQQEKGVWKQVIIDTQKCERKSTNDVVSCEFTARRGGTYTVTASVLDEKERRNESELTVWVAGAANPEDSRNPEKQDVELIPDKKEYAPDETAEILVNAPFYPAEGIMTLKRGGLVKTERFTLEKASTVLRIPIKERYLPNIHVAVTLVGTSPLRVFGDERDAKLPKIPAFADGGLNLDISTASRRLNVSAEPLDKTIDPGGKTKVNIAVRDNKGNAVANSEIALMAVDESVLALTNYKIDNPLDVFYEKLLAETSDSHSRKNILLTDNLLNYDETLKIDLGFGNRQGGSISANSNARPVGTPNGLFTIANSTAASNTVSKPVASGAQFSIDGFTGGKMPPKANNPLDSLAGQELTPEEASSMQIMQLRRNFAALAIFAPSVKTDAAGKATVDLKLPDNLTRYRITAVAVTKSKQFGLGESNITAKQPLMVRPSAPRFMNFGDRIELPVVLQNQTGSAMTVNVAIRSNNAGLTDGGGRRLTIPAGDRAEIRFPVTTEKTGLARLQIAASSGSFSDAAEIQIPVYTPATTEAFAAYGIADQNGAIIQPIAAPGDVFPEFGGLEITTGSTQLQELTDAFIYLQNYPFECSEQI